MKNHISPELKREENIMSFDKYWYIDYKELKIRHIPLIGLSKIKDFLFWRKKHKVEDLYWWAKRKSDSEEMIAFPEAVEHDSIKVDNSNSPRRYQMKNCWTISPEDLKYLYSGPLFDEAGKTLVDYQSKFRKYAPRVLFTLFLNGVRKILGF